MQILIVLLIKNNIIISGNFIQEKYIRKFNYPVDTDIQFVPLFPKFITLKAFLNKHFLRQLK